MAQQLAQQTDGTAQQIEDTAVDALIKATSETQTAADVPTSPASLWASESKGHYSITHSADCDTNAWIDCDCVIQSD